MNKTSAYKRLFCVMISLSLPQLLAAQSKWLNQLPDFSGVGYEQGNKAIPIAQVMVTVEPGAQAEKRIQHALDSVASLPLNTATGLRGAVLLKQGHYKIIGTLYIKASGVVLRGEGENTVLEAVGTGKRDLIRISGTGNRKEVPGTRKRITNSIISVGSKRISVTDTKNLKPGMSIVLFHPGSDKWIQSIKMNQIVANENTKQWEAGEYDLSFERSIVAIRNNELVLDNPVMLEMDQQITEGYVFGYSADQRLNNVGIERLQCISAYAAEEDEDHGWVAVSINRTTNSWVMDVTARHFGYSAVHLGDQATQITVLRCNSLDPKSKITGSRRYSFNNDGQKNLFVHCYARGGRHDYVTGARTCGPNVFLHCTAQNSHADIGPHHRWSVGTLYDNIKTDGEINVQDRGNWGTGHGWAGVTQVIWNSTAAKAAVQSPWASGKNFAIGLNAVKYEGRLPGRPDGEWDHIDPKQLKPASLYSAQMATAHHSALSFLKKRVLTTLKPTIIKDAAWALQQQPETITSFPATRSAGSRNDFYSEGDYWWPNPIHPDSPYIRKDGESYPNNFTAHRESLIRFSKIVGALAAAYQLTGNEEYATHASKHCKAWLVDSATKMNPSLLYAQAIKGRVTGRGIGIIDTIHFLDVVMGILAMERSAAFQASLWQDITNWFDQYLTWLTTHPYGIEEMQAKNNHGTCWLMQVAVFSKLTRNAVLQSFAADHFNNILHEQMAANGSFPLELSRTKPYGYSIFNLDAMLTIAQVLNPVGWSEHPTGQSLKTAIEFLYPYVKNKRKWPYQKDVMYWNDLPVAPNFLLFGALGFQNENWMNTWMNLEHSPSKSELIRNQPIRYSTLWF